MEQRDINWEELKRSMSRFTWETAETIYNLCKDKSYKSKFQNQVEMAKFLGVSKGRISQLKNGYKYYLDNRDTVDLKKGYVDVAYRLSCKLKNEDNDKKIEKENLLWFMEWLEKEEKTTLEKCTQKQVDQFVETYIEMPSTAFGISCKKRMR